MTALYALYEEPEVAQRAVDHLRTAGVDDADIVVMSSEPFEAFEFSHRDRADWLYGVAVAGGIAGLLAGVWLTRATQLSWPLPTSGMPIVAPWPNLIVIFELTMLGAILSTVVTLFLSAKLPGRLPRFYDPEISRGYILVGVHRPPEDVAHITRALERARAGRIRTID